MKKKKLFFLFITLLATGIGIISLKNYYKKSENAGLSLRNEEIVENSKKDKGKNDDEEKNEYSELEADHSYNRDTENQNQLQSKMIMQEAPFVVQAPFGKWSETVFQEGCEEASILMAHGWQNDIKLSPAESEKMIRDIAQFETEKYGHAFDFSSNDTFAVFRSYFKTDKAKHVMNISIEELKNQLYRGNIIIVPTDGKKLKNPYYTPPGPEVHMVLIVGYDPDSDEFIVNDPGTKQGKEFRYNSHVFFDAIADYKTDNIKGRSSDQDLKNEKNAIIVWK